MTLIVWEIGMKKTKERTKASNNYHKTFMYNLRVKENS